MENGATVSTITKSSDAAENAVSITNNGTITASVGVEVSGTAPATKVEDKDIKSTLTDAGGYVKLKATQTISSSLTISKDTVLDLNGQTLMLGENQILVQSNLTVIDTTNDQGKICKTNNTPSKNTAIQVKEGGNLIINGGNFSTQHKQMIDVASQSSLTINGGKIETNNMGVYVFGTDAKCTINGGEFKTGSACVSGNGSNDKWGTYIEINGGKLVSDNDIAIYHPQVGALVINGGYVKGATAIYQKAGTMTINGGVFEATMEYKDYQYKGTGANPTGDCILFDACTGYGNGSIVANISLNSTKISVNANSIGKAQKVKGYVYNSDNAPIIIWNGEAVTSIDVSSK